MLFIEVNIGLETLRLVSKLILLGLTSALTSSNWSQLTNPDISGALYTLRIQYEYTQTQCEDGARDVRVL